MFVRVLSILPTLLFLAGRLWAQAYEPGLLVRSTGDTLRGEIENGFWVEPPTFVRYRSSASAPSELLPARQLRAISFTNGRYFRHEALLLNQAAETRLDHLVRGNVVRMQTDSVMAEVLLSGPIELLRVVRPGATHYEMRRPNQPPLSLSGRLYLRETRTGSWEVVEGNNYRNQLELYFVDCPAASSAAQVAPFTAEGLAEVAQAYATTCAPTQQPARSWLAASAPRRRGAFQGGLLAGARYNYIGSPDNDLAATTSGHQLLPFGGLYAELLLPSRITGFYGELSVSSFRNQTTQSLGYNSAGVYQYTTYSYHGTLATARLGVRYYFPLVHDQQFLLGFGFEYNKVWSLTTNGFNAAASSYYYGPPSDDVYFPTPTLLPNVTLGWRRQRFTLTLDGQLYHASTDSGDISSLFFGGNWATRLGLSYRLGRHPDSAPPALR